MPRPSKLNPTVENALCEHISRGVPCEIAAVACGISARTFYRWMKEGEDAKEGEYWQFWQAITRARSIAECSLVGVVHGAAMSGEWRAAVALLERLYPSRYSKRRLEQTSAMPWKFVVGGGHKQDIVVNLVEVPEPVSVPDN